ncbi:hypothetical protein LUZ60_009155 [Juncus effusus]|nr:hypothetical protein LUZ60_009155 [Juncus effusus]
MYVFICWTCFGPYSLCGIRKAVLKKDLYGSSISPIHPSIVEPTVSDNVKNINNTEVHHEPSLFRILQRTWIEKRPPILPLLSLILRTGRELREERSSTSMAKSLIFMPLSPHVRLFSSAHQFSAPSRGFRRASLKVKLSLNDMVTPSDLGHIGERIEGLVYTLADAAVAVAGDSVAGSVGDDVAKKSNGGWFGFISEAMEVVLKILKDGLSAVHIPYSYGFAIILLTVIVKVATLPLTKQQVESQLEMQKLQPKLKAIQTRYAGNQERIQLETARLYRNAGVNPLAGCLPTLATIPVWIGLYQALSNVANEGLLTEGFFWIPSLAGPTTIAARQSGSGISWLFPFVDGHPPLGWSDTAAYLVLPILLVLSQYVSMEIMKPPQTDDPTQKNTLLIFKFLPLMIGYFSLSVPSGLSIYWFTNNILSTAQQVWLRKLGGAKPASNQEVITAGRAIRTDRTGDRSKQLKEEGNKNIPKAFNVDASPVSDSEEDSTEETNEEKGEIEPSYSSSTAKQLPNYSQKKGKRSKRKRTVQ